MFTPAEIRRSSHGTLAREGILPMEKTFTYGIGGTRFYSEDDVRLAAFSYFLLGLDVFNDRPFTPKEERMVRGMAFRLGTAIQRGGFVGQQRCLVEKALPLNQCNDFKPQDVKDIVRHKHLTYASLWRKRGKIVETLPLRIDIEDPAKDHQNIQIQVNKQRKKRESTTCAHVQLYFNLAIFRPIDVAQHQHVLRKVRNAFILSAMTGASYGVKLSGNRIT